MIFVTCGMSDDKIRFVKRLVREVLSNFVLCLINMYMTRKNASKETINILITNAKSAISDSEHILKNTELIKSRLSTFDGANYLQLLFELLSGSLLAVYEVCSDMKNMLSTDNVYVKRFHMQMINLSQYEWCKYLVGRDQGGVIYFLIL